MIFLGLQVDYRKRIENIEVGAGIVWSWQEDVKYTKITADQFNMVTALLVKECGLWLDSYIGREYSHEATQELYMHFGVK